MHPDVMHYTVENFQYSKISDFLKNLFLVGKFSIITIFGSSSRAMRGTFVYGHKFIGTRASGGTPLNQDLPEARQPSLRLVHNLIFEVDSNMQNCVAS